MYMYIILYFYRQEMYSSWLDSTSIPRYEEKYVIFYNFKIIGVLLFSWYICTACIYFAFFIHFSTIISVRWKKEKKFWSQLHNFRLPAYIYGRLYYFFSIDEFFFFFKLVVQRCDIIFFNCLKYRYESNRHN